MPQQRLQKLISLYSYKLMNRSLDSLFTSYVFATLDSECKNIHLLFQILVPKYQIPAQSKISQGDALTQHPTECTITVILFVRTVSLLKCNVKFLHQFRLLASSSTDSLENRYNLLVSSTLSYREGSNKLWEGEFLPWTSAEGYKRFHTE